MQCPLPKKNPSKILHRHGKNHTELDMERQNSRIIKTVMYNKGTFGGIIMPDFKLF